MKSILVVTPGKVAQAEEHLRGMGIRVVTGHRYLGGFLGDVSLEKEWLATKVEGWTASIATLAGVALKHLQSAYAGLQKSLQQEWDFLQRLTPGVGAAFAPRRGGPPGGFSPGSLPGTDGGTPDEGKHPPAGEAGRAGHP